MKKAILTMMLLAFIPAAVHAQVTFGGKAGLNIAGVTGDDTDDTESLIGFRVGALANIPVSGEFDVQPEVTYSLRGFKDGDFDIKIDYVDLEVLGSYEIVDGLDLQAGPLIGFNVSGKVDGPGGEQDLDNLESINFGIGVGAQYTLPMGLFFQVRYDMGFNNVFEDQGEGSFDAKNCNIGFNIGYMFGNGEEEL